MNDSLAENLIALDETIDWYNRANELINEKYGRVDGHVTGERNRLGYERERDAILLCYRTECPPLVKRLKRNVDELESERIDFEEYVEEPPEWIRRSVMLGRLHFFYADFDMRALSALDLPIPRPLCVENARTDRLQRLMLNLLFTFPPGLCRFHVFDPNHFGGSVGRFDVLREVGEIFPDREFLYDLKQLDLFLGELREEFATMRQKLFPAQNCRSWTEYNRQMRALNLPKKLLPYRVLVCFELPDACSPEQLKLLKRLAAESADLGFLLLFSYDPEALIVRKPTFDGTIEAFQNDRALSEFRALHQSSFELERAFERLNGLEELKQIRFEEESEPSLAPSVFEKHLRAYRSILEKKRGQIVEFDELIRAENRFDAQSIDGLEIPLGTDTGNGEVLTLKIGDEAPHGLIGGQTGSGKSNLLHVLIANACWHYSPDELELYLLDFKDGVEFATYTRPILPHARLVATQADPIYARTVLEHLNDEITRRNELFKRASKTAVVTNFADFRRHFPSEKLPRRLLIVDEFQRIFEDDSNAVMKLLENLTKQGRSVGIHLLFATQTFRSLSANPKIQGFVQIKGQFGARIALKCSVADSHDIFDNQRNDAAAELQIPYAILNTDNGEPRFNKKFAVPRAKAERITATIEELVKRCAISARTRVFDGQTLPKMPPPERFKTEGVSLLIGRRLDFEGSEFVVELNDALEQNILFCGDIDPFFACVINFARTTTAFDETVVIGRNPIETLRDAKFFSTPEEFVESLGENRFDRRRLIILDECVMPKMPFTPTEKDKRFERFWTEASEHGSHVAAFYRTFNQLTESNLNFKKLFEHRITHHLPLSNAGTIGGVQFYNQTPIDDRFKAAYFFKERLTWFQPFEV